MESLLAIIAIIAGVSTLVQAVVAIAVFRQDKRVDKLAGVVQEMANQTKELAAQAKVLSDEYVLQLELSKRERMPVFRLTSKVVRKINERNSIFAIENIGTAAHNLALPNKENFVTVERVAPGGGPKSYPTWKFILINTKIAKDFDFVFTYDTDDNKSFRQEIFYMDGNLSLDLPIDTTETFYIVP